MSRNRTLQGLSHYTLEYGGFALAFSQQPCSLVCSILCLASQNAIANCEFKITTLTASSAEKSLRDHQEWNCKSLRLEIANSKSQCLFSACETAKTSRSCPNLAKLRNRKSLRFSGGVISNRAVVNWKSQHQHWTLRSCCAVSQYAKALLHSLLAPYLTGTLISHHTRMTKLTSQTQWGHVPAKQGPQPSKWCL